MSAPDDPRRSTWSGIGYVAVLGILLLVYPLSVGPLAWLAKNGYLPGDLEEYLAIQILYAPIIWMFENCEWYSRIHMWYLRLWGI